MIQINAAVRLRAAAADRTAKRQAVLKKLHAELKDTLNCKLGPNGTELVCRVDKKTVVSALESAGFSVEGITATRGKVEVELVTPSPRLTYIRVG